MTAHRDPTAQLALPFDEPPAPAADPSDLASWTAEERHLLARHRAGEIVVVNIGGKYMRSPHPNLITWAKAAGVFVLINRDTVWGNPYVLGRDGDRDTVCTKYEQIHLPHRPELLARLGELPGKILGCHCAPLRCHGDVLKRWAEAAAAEPSDAELTAQLQDLDRSPR